MGTFSDRLALYKPANGEIGWGDEVDNNFDVLDTVVGGAYVNAMDPQFGAVGDGVTDDSAAFQAAVDAVGGQGGTLVIPPGVYYVASKIVLPTLAVAGTHTENRFLVSGYGATLWTDQAITIMGRVVPASYDSTGPNSVQMSSIRFVIEGITFSGWDGAASTAGSIGLDMYGQFGMRVADCMFTALDIGLRQTHCLMTLVHSCITFGCISYGFQLRSGAGIYSGGTTSNSGCNHTQFYSCRDAATTGALAGWHIRASGFVSLIDCIGEFFNPVNEVDFASDSSSVKAFTIRNFHNENNPSNAIFKLAMNVGGLAIVEDIFVQTPGTTLFDTDGGFAAQLYVGRIPWYAAQYFGDVGSGGVEYIVDSQMSSFDIFDDANWVGGVQPQYFTVLPHRHALGGNPATEWVPMNGNLNIASELHVGSSIDTTTPGPWFPQAADHYWHPSANIGYQFRTTGSDANPGLQLSKTNGLQLGAGGGSALDVQITRAAANELAMGANDGFRTGQSIHGSLPAAGNYNAGTQFFCTTDKQPLWSDGSVWVEADGTNH